MVKKPKTKRAFDWRTYSKPVRLLTPEQESAFASGLLAPLLAWATADARSRFEIRARAAGIYHHGLSLVRVSGNAEFVAEVEHVHVESGDAPAPARRVSLGSPQDVAALVEELEEARTAMDRALDAPDGARHRRSFAHAIAAGNSGSDLFADGLVVVDSDYALGRRKVDLVALLRTEGVTGPGGFANPDLAFIDVRVPGQSLTGPAGLAAVADDLADFAKALSGEHIRRTATEICELTAQKVRLGLLPAELDVRSVADTMPHFIVAFAEADPTAPKDDAAIIELHERLSARHYPTHRLRFVHFTTVPVDGDGLALEEGDTMDYREFKAYRYADRA